MLSAAQMMATVRLVLRPLQTVYVLRIPPWFPFFAPVPMVTSGSRTVRPLLVGAVMHAV